MTSLVRNEGKTVEGAVHMASAGSHGQERRRHKIRRSLAFADAIDVALKPFCGQQTSRNFRLKANRMQYFFCE